MAYAAGNIIGAADYNSLAATLNSQLSTGTGSHGLGQSAVATVAVSNNVTATQWATLISKTNLVLAHEGQTQITPSSVVAGDIVSAQAAITTGGTTAYNNTGTTGIALSDSAAYAATYTGAWGTTGNRRLVATHTVTFASGDAARYFFNAGGKIKLVFAKSGGSATTRNSEWAALCTACGSIQFGFNNTTKVGGSGTVALIRNANNGGYWNLTGTAAQHFYQVDGVLTYSTNSITTYAAWSGTPSNGGYPVLTFYTYLTNVWVNAFQDAVDGTTTVNLVVSSPATTYLTNTWGTPTVSSSIVTN